MSLNRLLHSFDCEIHINIANNIIKKRISTAKNHVEKLHKLQQNLHLKLMKIQKFLSVIMLFRESNQHSTCSKNNSVKFTAVMSS